MIFAWATQRVLEYAELPLLLVTGKPQNTCTMVITEPNKFVAWLHDRMPVILDESSSTLGLMAARYWRPW